MGYWPDTISDLVECLEKEKLVYRDTIIIGDNSSGKSYLLKSFVRKVLAQKNVYFIDAVNRGFDVTKVLRLKEDPPYKRTIIDTRLQDDYFNIKDSFNCYGTATERIEQIYSAYEEKVQSLFRSLVKDEFEILYGNSLGEVRFREGIGLLSSGYQAILRILLELSYYNNILQKANNNEAWIVIDELDEFLSPRFASAIMPFLKISFPHMNFIVATHSIDLVMSAKDANLIVLDSKGYEVFDSNDYYTFADVQKLFLKVFRLSEPQASEIDAILRRLLNNRINSAWSHKDEEDFFALGNMQLSASQKLIVRQIKEW